MRSLYTICGREASLPKSLSIPLCYNPMDTPRCSGGFADLWKGNHDGREVAAKALRVYRTSDLDGMKKVDRPRIGFVNALTVPYAAIL